MLGETKDSNSQVLIATHSSDVLRGLLDSSSDALTVVRLTRESQINHASQIEPDKIRQLWADPLLRYSNILDGLFHDGVILCEGDADCRFYQSMLDTSISRGTVNRESDLLFTHCGGKSRMPTVIGALSAVKVPVRVVCDFDVLRDEKPLRPIIEELGGDWSSIEADWKVVKKTIDAFGRKAPQSKQFKEQVQRLLSDIKTSTVPREVLMNLQDIAKFESGWDGVKQAGKSMVPSGDATERLGKLLAELRRIGLFVVEVGELESFARQVPRHGPAWVNEVHKRGLHTNDNLREAREFVETIIESFKNRQI